MTTNNESLPNKLVGIYAEYLLRLTDIEGVKRSIEALVVDDMPDSILARFTSLPEDVSRVAVLELLEASIRESPATVPDGVAARRILARKYAEQIVDGTLSPYEGARRIWWELWTDCRELKELAIFAGLASEYEDDSSEAHRSEYQRDIVDEACVLLRNAHSNS
ncbi:hypothetical protein [Planctomycetes bacterium Pan216]|uniref:hypothetical protein n=1 Tax=Kolteria novifilia TaxID=2527975 RepID=UPI0011A5F2B5